MHPAPCPPELLDDAVEVARAAAEVALRWFRSEHLTVDAKGDGTPVTQADREAERLVRSLLRDRYPDDGVVGEEEDSVEGTSGRRWVIDPIDGTKAFSRGVPTFGTLLAVEDAHGPVAGVIVTPALGETVAAGRGRGCTHNGRPAQVSERTHVARSVCSSSGFEHWEEGALLRLKRAGWDLRTWGDAWGYLLVATGRIEAMVDPQVSLWDVAPMPVILAEAGGRFSDLEGSPSADHGSGVATNGHLHDVLLDQLRA